MFFVLFFLFRPKNFCYIPGDLTEETQVHHTRNSLVNEPTSASASKHQHLPPLNSLYVEQHKCTDEGELLNKTEKTARDKSNGGTDEHILSHIEQLPDCPDATDEKMRSEVTEKPGENNTIPLIPAVYNFQSARKMAQENLEHQPLPDSIMDRAYRKMQAQGAAYPELALDVYPVATGMLIRVADFILPLSSVYFHCHHRSWSEDVQCWSDALHQIESVSTENVWHRPEAIA